MADSCPNEPSNPSHPACGHPFPEERVPAMGRITLFQRSRYTRLGCGNRVSNVVKGEFFGKMCGRNRGEKKGNPLHPLPPLEPPISDEYIQRQRTKTHRTGAATGEGGSTTEYLSSLFSPHSSILPRAVIRRHPSMHRCNEAAIQLMGRFPFPSTHFLSLDRRETQ